MKTKVFAIFVCMAIVGIFVISCNRNKVLLSSINSLGCDDSTIVAAKDYRYLLKNDTIVLGEETFTNVRYSVPIRHSEADYIWRNSKNLYEVRLRNEKLKIRRFCDPEMDEPTTN